ncbi:MAG: phosphate ABC transporter permease PstA [Promethearchaeota archaeon]
MTTTTTIKTFKKMKNGLIPVHNLEQKSGKSFLETLIKPLLFVSATFSILVVFLQIFFFFQQASGAFEAVTIWDFLTGTSWRPVEQQAYGALPLIVGTFLTTLGAMIITVPIGILTAVYIAELAPLKLKKILKFFVELLSGIPSVVYGYFGLIVLTNWIRIFFDRPTGQSWLAGSIILAIMALPTVISISVNSLNAVPNEYREAALGMGANRWEAISKIILPAAFSGIKTAIILGTGRAIGETMAVLMVSGNTTIIPSPITNIFSPVRTITATLGIEITETAIYGTHYQLLFALVVVLYVIIIIINALAEFVLEKFNNERDVKPKPQNKQNKQHKQKYSKKSFVTALHIKIGFKSNKQMFYRVSFYLLGFWVLASWLGVWIALGSALLILVATKIYSRIPNRMQENMAFGLIYSAVITVFAILVIVIGFVIIKGVSVISWEFLTSYPRDLGRKGGIFPAIVGSLYLVAGAVAFAVPLGIASGLYLAEYTKPNKFNRLIRMSIDNLNGTPSIVFGLFGFIVFCIFTGWGKTLLAGQLTLALMILPTLIRTTEQAILSVRQDVREGSYALGANKWDTVKKIVIPSAIPGIVTGTILGMGRAIGETAPIMFTAAVFSLRRLPNSFLSPVMALPYHLFLLSTTVPGGQENAYGTAFVLFILVLILYGLATLFQSKIEKHSKKHFILR